MESIERTPDKDKPIETQVGSDGTSVPYKHKKPKRRKSNKKRKVNSESDRKDEKENQPSDLERAHSQNSAQKVAKLNSDENDSEYEFKRSVSWKSNIESSKEFQSSVMEQNVFVSMEDAEFAKDKGEKTDQEHAYLWDESSAGKNMIFSPEKPHVVQRAVAKQSTDGARGFKGFTTGRHTFRFKFNDKPWGSNCSIGICTADSNMHVEGYQHVFGCDSRSWVWDIPSGCLLHDGQSKLQFDSPIEEKSIYMTLDLNKGNLYFQPKGRDRFLAFKDLMNVRAEVFPCVSLVYGLAEVRISLKSTTYPSQSKNKHSEKGISKKRQNSSSKIDSEIDDKRENNKAESVQKKELQEDIKEFKKVVAYADSSNMGETYSSLSPQKTSLFSGSDQKEGVSESGNMFSENDKTVSDYSRSNSMFSRDEKEDKPASTLSRSNSMFSRDEKEDKPATTLSRSNSMFSRDEKEDKPATTLSRSKSMFSRDENEEKRSSTLSRSNSMFSRDETEPPSRSMFSQSHSTSSSRNDTENVIGSMFSPIADSEAKRPGSIFSRRDTQQSTDSMQTVDETDRNSSKIPETSAVKEAEFQSKETNVQVSNKPESDVSIDRQALYKKSSNLNGWSPSNDVYLVRDGSIIRENVNEKELSDLSTNNTSLSVLSGGDVIPDAALYSRPVHQVKQQLSDEEEPVDAEYTAVSSLQPHQQYNIRMYHGWDVTNRGGSLQLYPGVPHICVPVLYYGDKVQAIRGRRGFRSGIHKWSVKELKTFNPKVCVEEMDVTRNTLLVGVADNEQRTFNFGYHLNSVGKHVWLFDLETGVEIHGLDNTWKATQAASDISGKELIDMTKGLEIVLNCYKHKLTFIYNGKTVKEMKNIKGTELHPLVLFNGKALFPVQIDYLEGPREYMDECLDKLEVMKTVEELATYVGATRQLSSKTGVVPLTKGLLNTYDWGGASTAIKIKWGESVKLDSGAVSPGQHYIAIAEKPLCGKRHKIEFSTESMKSFVFGLISERFDETAVVGRAGIRNVSSTGTLLGSDMHSWSWNPQTCSLYHGGLYIGRYPSQQPEFQIEKYDKLLMTVDFNPTNTNIVSFTAVSSLTNKVLDLGIAFVNLPDAVYPCIAILSEGVTDNTQLHMKYISGPEGFIKGTVEAKTCSIL